MKNKKNNYDEIQILDLLKQSRVKKYKSYRNKIKKDYYNSVKKNNDYDKFVSLENKIKKINNKLIIDKKNTKNIFVKIKVNESNEFGYIDEIRTIIAKFENKNLKEFYNNNILKKTFDNIEKQNENEFDWLQNDKQYIEFTKINEWIESMNNHFEFINNTIEEKIYKSKSNMDTYKNENDVSKIIDNNIGTYKIYKNKKNLIFFWISFSFLILFILLIIIFVFIFIGV